MMLGRLHLRAAAATAAAAAAAAAATASSAAASPSPSSSSPRADSTEPSSSSSSSAWRALAPRPPASAASAVLPPPPWLFGAASAVPLVPRVLRGLDLDEPRDPLAFTEWCALRGAGAVVVGGVLGFGMGALFSGYGALAPYDPALRDWQNVQETQARAAAAEAAKRAAGAGAASTAGAAGAAGASTAAVAAPAAGGGAISVSGVSAAAAAAPRSGIAPPFATPSLSGGFFASAARLPASAASAASAAFASSAASAAPAPAVALSTAPAAAAAASASSTLGALPFPTEAPKVTLRVAFVSGLREMRSKGWSSAKSFGVVGGVFSVIECALEKLRGVKDMKNAVASGFATGAILAAPAGPAAMVMGGAGFAAFSAVIELLGPYIFEGH